MSYSLVLDEPAHGDKVEELDGLKFVISDSLYKMSQGFKIKTEQKWGQTYISIRPNQVDSSGGDCNTCSSCG